MAIAPSPEGKTEPRPAKPKPEPKEVEENREPLNYEKCVLKVPMYCEGCEKKVEEILTNTKGVYTADIDFSQQQVTVRGNVDSDTLKKKLEEKTKKHVELWPEKSYQKQTKQGKGKSKEKQSNPESSREEAAHGGEEGKETVPTKSRREKGNSTTGCKVVKGSDRGASGKVGAQWKEVKAEIKQGVTSPAGSQPPVSESEGGAEKSAGGCGGREKKKMGHKGNSTNNAVEVPERGLQEQQAQPRPQEGSSYSRYPHSVVSPPNSTRPPSTSSSGSNSVNYERPTDQPQSPSHVSPAEAAGATAFLNPEPLECKTCVLKVPMYCEGCKKKVEEVLRNTKGVYTADIDFSQQQVTVRGNVDSDTLKKKLEEKTKKHVELWPEKSYQKQTKQGKGKSKEKQSNPESSEEAAHGGEEGKETVPAKSRREKGNSTTGCKVVKGSDRGATGKVSAQWKEVKAEIKQGVTSPAGSQPPVSESEGGAEKSSGGCGGREKKKKGHKENSTNNAVEVPERGLQEQQAQPRPQEGSSYSRYPHSVVSPPNSTRPPSTSSSGSNSVNYERPTDQPQSPSHVSPAEAAGATAFLNPEPLECKTCVLKVPMYCEGCKKKVEEVLRNTKGVYTVDIDFSQQQVTVRGNVDSDTLKKKLEEKTKKHVELWPEKSYQKQRKQGKGKSKEKQSNPESSREEAAHGGEEGKETVPAKSRREKGNSTTGCKVVKGSDRGATGKVGAQWKEVKAEIKQGVTSPAGSQPPVSESEGGAEKSSGGCGGREKKKKGHKENSTNNAVEVPERGSQKQQAQPHPQEGSSHSWYPPPVVSSPYSTWPTAPSSSGSNSVNYQRPTDWPQSPPHFSPADVAGITALLEDKSVDELQELLSDKDAYNQFLRSVDQIRYDELCKETLQLARSNLEKESPIMELRNQCMIIRTRELAAAQEKLSELEKQKEDIMNSYSPASILYRLHEVMNKTEEESEALHRQLLDKEIDLGTFVHNYKKLRNSYHRRALIQSAAKASSIG